MYSFFQAFIGNDFQISFTVVSFEGKTDCNEYRFQKAETIYITHIYPFKKKSYECLNS